MAGFNSADGRGQMKSKASQSNVLRRFKMSNYRPALRSVGIVTLLLSGCELVNFDPSFGIWPGVQARKQTATIIEQVSKCPPLVDYSRSFLDAAAMEFEQLPQRSKLATLVGDYGRLRAVVRQC